MYITCPSGLEPLLKQELESFGIRDVSIGYRGVFIPQEMKAAYLVNYRSRIATRALWPLTKFRCTDKHSLYREAKRVDWTRVLNPKKTFAIDANVTHPELRNSLFAAQIVKDAICDQLKEKYGARPSIDVASPDVQVNLFVHNSTGVLSFDTSGAPLYKRGYRAESTPAPLQESIAAAILLQAGYSSEKIFCDPFCGSGTLLIEAAMIASHTPAGYFRKTWGFFHMPGFSKEAWERVKAEADSSRTPLVKGKIFGADIDPKAVSICRSHLKATGFEDAVNLQQKDIALYQPSSPLSLVVTNPPYGVRLPVSMETYRAAGRFFKTRSAPSAEIYMLNTEETLVKGVGLPFEKEMSLFNGGLSVDLYRFALDSPLA